MGVIIKSQKITDNYAIYCADTTEAIKDIKENSIGMIVYSPPFSSLYRSIRHPGFGFLLGI